MTAALETAKQDVAEGRVQEERAAYGRAFGEEPPKYERTAEGEQAVVPGAEARQIPTTPLRAARPQRPVQETPLFAEGEQAEQPRLPGVEERRQPYGGGDITRPTRFFHGTSGEELTTFRPGLIYMAPDPENASVFAANPILNRGRANPRVLAVEAQPGRVKDISRAVDDAVMERTDLDVDATVSQESQIARREGYRYVAFDHPGIGEDFRAVVSLYPDSDLGVNAIARSKEKSAPATFLGYQESVGGAAPIPLYQLTEPIGKHPKDDTLSRDTLRALGVEPPEPPPFEEWQRMRGVEEGQALFEGRKEYTFRDDANDTQRANADAIVARLTGPLGGLSHPGVPVGLPAISGLGTPAAGGPHAVPGGRGGAGLEESRPALKEGAGVRVLGAKIGGELARRGRVTFAGQRIETEEDLARIGQIASDPQIESFRVIPVKDGIALPDSVLSARLPGTAPVFLDFSPEQARRIADNQITDIRQLPRPVWETLERLKRLGADGYWLLHNHPSGTPLPSHADLAVTDLFRKAVPGFQGHVVIDSKAYGTIRTDSSGELRRYVEPAKFAVRSTEPIRESSFLGRQLANADQLAQLGVEASKEAVGGVIIYQGADGTVSAVEDAPYRFLAGPNVRDHLLARMPEYGSQSVFVYLPRENGPIVDALDPLVKQGLIRDFIVQGTPSASQAMTGAEQVGAENAYRRLMQRFSRERQYRVHEERAPYTDPSLLRDLTDYGQEVRRTKRDFDSWADAMRKEFGERVEPHLGKAWDEMRRTTRASTTEAGAPVEVQVDKASPPPVVGMTQPQLILQRHKQTVEGAAETLLANQGIVRDKTILLSDQILDMMVAGKLNLEAIERVLPEGMTVAEFGQDLWRPAISDAARRLQVLSVLERRINKLLVDGKVPESAREEMDQTLRLAREIDEGVVMQAWWRRLDNVRRGMLVTQLATAIRNFESQVGRLGMDVLDLGLQRGIQKMTGTTPTANPWEAIRAFTEVFKQFKPEEFKRLKGETDQILEAFPRQLDRLFGTYLSDVMAQAHDRATEKARAEMGPIGRGTDTALTGAERVVDLLNIANKGQEFIVRRAVFQAHLDDVLTRRGMDLSDLVSKGETGKIPEDAIKESVAKALELTFATPPTYGTAAWHFVKLMNLGAPLTTSILPFPRFMTNALRFQYEFSPFGFLPVIKHLVSASDRKAILAGDSKAISRATIGSAMFLSAYLLRLLQDDDNKWYELSVPGVDRPVDVRPFNPFASYLFIAELTKRMFKGTLYDKLDWNEILQGVASANLRAGTGLYALEQAIAGIGELDNLKKAKEFGSRALGEYLAGFLMPFQQVKDFLAPFVTDFAEVKDRSLDPFSAPLRDRLPGLVALGLADPLPPAYSPTRAEPIQREAPVLRQTTGVTLSQEKNPAEKELAKFQFSRKEILPKSGDPMFDNLWAKHMGQLVEERLVPYVDSESYQGLADGAKMKRLKDRLIPLRAIAKARTTREMRQMGEGERLKAIKDEATPRRERMYREERRQQREDIAP